MSVDRETAQMISESMKFRELLHKATPVTKKIAEAALRGHYALLIPDDPRVDSWEVWTDREPRVDSWEVWTDREGQK